LYKKCDYLPVFGLRPLFGFTVSTTSPVSLTAVLIAALASLTSFFTSATFSII